MVKNYVGKFFLSKLYQKNFPTSFSNQSVIKRYSTKIRWLTFFFRCTSPDDMRSLEFDDDSERSTEICGKSDSITRKLERLADSYLSGCGKKKGQKAVTKAKKFAGKLDRVGKCHNGNNKI